METTPMIPIRRPGVEFVTALPGRNGKSIATKFGDFPVIIHVDPEFPPTLISPLGGGRYSIVRLVP